MKLIKKNYNPPPHNENLDWCIKSNWNGLGDINFICNDKSFIHSWCMVIWWLCKLTWCKYGLCDIVEGYTGYWSWNLTFRVPTMECSADCVTSMPMRRFLNPFRSGHSYFNKDLFLKISWKTCAFLSKASHYLDFKTIFLKCSEENAIWIKVG